LTLFDPPEAAGGPEDPGPAKLRLVVAYDGTAFHGFAESRGVRTVAGTLVDALERLLHDRPEIVVAGRTDRGVHAWGNVVSLEVPPATDPWKVQDSLNSMLGPEIVVREADLVEGTFDARRSARWRRYRYTIVNRPVPDPFLARYAWWISESLDLRALRLAADPFVGEHDFSSFCRRGPEGTANVRRVIESRWEDRGGGVLVYEIRANAFCWQMVRSVVGTLVEAGRGKRTPGEMLAIIRACDRQAAGQMAPAHGLCLVEVGYDG
jgi:tRNA pseudouridine38-40 synthase